MSEYLPGWTVQIDPPAVAPDRTMLDLNSGAIGVESVDWGDASVTSSETQEGQYGNSVADFVIPNRTITLKLFLGADDSGTEETAREQLQQKVGLLQREGGQLLRQRAAGPAMYADIVSATPTIPDVYGETGGVEPEVSLALECLPDFYGDEITLDSIAVTGHCDAVLKQSGAQAVIHGDYPARCRILVTDRSGVNQLAAVWGVRSRHYDAASTAALTYEAEALTPLNGAAVTSLSGASGGHVVSITPPVAGTWVPILATNLLAGTKLTHQGTYRIRARVFSAAGVPQLQFVWGAGSLSVPVTNDAVTIPGSGAFYLLDLGTIRLDPTQVGSNAWVGALQALVTPSVDVQIDKLYLQPLDEAAAQLAYISVPSAAALNSIEAPTAASGTAGGGSTAWGNPANIEADDTLSTLMALTSASPTDLLEATGFGFAIPTGATIVGIEATIKRGVDKLNRVTDHQVSLIKAGTVQTPNKASSSFWAGNASTGIPVTYGGPTDLWGGAWTPSDVNDSGFGLALSVQSINVILVKPFVQFVQITVYFTLASGFTVAQDAVIYADQVAEIRTDGVSRTADGTVYGPVSQVVGDLPRLPPSGMEARPVELFVKPTRGDLDTLADSGLDAFTVQVKYWPCYLGRP